MKIRILCPGPSLRSYLTVPMDGDVIIAVNQAIRARICDWWCFGDAEAFWKSHASRHGAKCFTSRQSRERISHPGACPDESRQVRDIRNAAAFEEIGTPVPWETNWHRHSITAAMVLAEWLARQAGDGGGELAIYGVDWAGTDYFDAPADPGQAISEERWKAEEHAFGRVAAILIAAGLNVQLHRAADAGSRVQELQSCG